MYPNLRDIGIRNPENIKRYSLRKEGDKDILKVYFRKTGAMLIGRSSKYKFQRQIKTVSGGQHVQHIQGTTELSEINPTLHKIIKELDSLSLQVSTEKELKQQVLSDLKHLQSVVDNKIQEIEGKLDKLQ
ncbi:hypothetical protein DS885_09485 [Psychromonas sp. B3M02]|uniref:DUF3461 family protein n=1 Tax=unclassified Psychromonas TaxID=2614957 RepID=UPI000DE82948|nr:DUF3461 family protein [Psychromonas sp. B3M02]RBW45725.1 hypothetical protein DS885_09485 [Psychromonas sp. B3M02]